MKKITLTDGNLDKLPSLKEYPNLKEIHLGNNQIKDVREIENCPVLEKLYLESNEISQIVFNKQLPKLRQLSLGNNHIESLSFLKKVENTLAKLDLGTNRIKSKAMKDLQNLPYLKKLILGKNSIDDLTFLTSVPSLETLDIRYLDLLRQIEYLPLQKLTSLKEVSIKKQAKPYIKKLQLRKKVKIIYI